MSILDLRAAPGARLTEAGEVLPLEAVTPGAAQSRCNFVVHEPTWLPEGCEITEHTLRPEQPPGRPEGTDAAKLGLSPWSEANLCALRTVIAGDGRSLRLKQFLYDWAPPAAGIASLWDSPEVAPFPCLGATGWTGVDYHDRPGACVYLPRAAIEAVAIEGTFAPEEFEQLLSSLRVADPAGAAAVDAAPFHSLNYWVHYRVPPTRPPYGLWAYNQRRRYHLSRMIDPAEAAGGLLPNAHGWEIDSALLMEDPEANHREIETIARRGSSFVRLSAMNADSAVALPVPPEPEDHFAAVRTALETRRGTLWLAALAEPEGPWEAVWEEDGRRCAAWFGPGAVKDRDEAVAFVEALARA